MVNKVKDNPPPSLWAALKPQQSGLFSLLYWVKYDKKYNAAFHENPGATMSQLFGIKDPLHGRLLRVSNENERQLPGESASAHRARITALIIEIFKDHAAEDLLFDKPQFW